MRVKDDVVALGPERSPERSAHETILDHQGNKARTLLQHRIDSLLERVVVVDSVGVRDRVGRSKVSQTGVTSFIACTESELTRVGGVENEGDHVVHYVESLLEVSGIVPPSGMSKSFTDVEGVGCVQDRFWSVAWSDIPTCIALTTTGIRVKTQDNVHAFRDSVVGDRLQILLLVSVVQLRSRNLGPSSVR